ncbi:MAG: hypothetical protein WKF65_18190 [Gaiellaceae bacterium]
MRVDPVREEVLEQRTPAAAVVQDTTASERIAASTSSPTSATGGPEP